MLRLTMTPVASTGRHRHDAVSASSKYKRVFDLPWVGLPENVGLLRHTASLWMACSGLFLCEATIFLLQLHDYGLL